MKRDLNCDKAAALRGLLNSPELAFIMEAHNGLSAKIAEEAGFKAIWASGLSMSAALGVRDNNEASWTQVLEVLEFMSDATTIPILVDGDTGYGNFNNTRRLIRKLEQRNIAGVCIEDKLFPKTNSFLNSEKQPLADMEEFRGKIKAAKDTQLDDAFSVVARVEALIAGWGLGEALRRAEAYRAAGADAILVHSKRTDASEIDDFMKEWGGRSPVVIVPTKYYTTPTDEFRKMGVNAVIWANHLLRAAIAAMQETAKRIYKDSTLVSVEEKIAPLAEVFRLQGAGELEAAEEKYLPTEGKTTNAVILAAAQGERLGDLTKDCPKALLKVNGRTILDTQLDSLNQIGIKNITVVRGFAKHKISGPNINTVDNDSYAGTKELYSLYLARTHLGENTVVCYGDILFKNYILYDLLNDGNDITVVVDADHERDVPPADDYRDFVKTDVSYSRKTLLQPVKLVRMSSRLESGEINGEFIGIWKVSGAGARVVAGALEEMSRSEDFPRRRMSDLFNHLLQRTPVAVKFIRGSWMDVDTILDYQKAGA